jgi:hypothetical protein
MGLGTLLQGGAFTYETRDQINTNFNLLMAGIFGGTQGNIYYVRPVNGDDNSNGLTPATAFNTLRQALAACTAGQNDIVLFCAEGNASAATTDYLSANLDWNKDLTHLIGVNNGPMVGQRSRVSTLSTATAFANMFTVSGDACLIANMAFYQGQMATNPSAASTCVTVSGERNHFVNCQISGIGHSDLDDAGSNSLTVSGSENVFDDCYIGLDTVIRATSVTEVILSGTNTRNAFRNCHFETYTSGSTFKMVSIATGTDRFVKFLNCDFVAVQNITSAAAPTGALGITTMNGQVIMKNPYVYGFAQITTADNAYVQVLGYNGLATDNLIGIAQGVNAA